MREPAADWPYPPWIGHRGAGKMAPENTLAAFRYGLAHGWRAFECDVKLSADGVPFLLHDDTLERTTNGQGPAIAQPWAALSRLDAGAWHGPAHAGEPPASLDAIAAFCRRNGAVLNIELKPNPGQDAETGRAVAAACRELWAGEAVGPLFSSFRPDALAGAREAAPEARRALLLAELWPGWLDAATALGCQAVVLHHPLAQAQSVATIDDAGLRWLAYTVNDPAVALRLLGLGASGLISDCLTAA